MSGASRFLKRLWRLVTAHVAHTDAAPVTIDVAALDPAQRELRRKVHETIVKVSDDVGRRYTFNTAIAAVMELLNALGKGEDEHAQARAVEREALETAVRLLAPVVPHVCQVLWETLGHDDLLIDVAWPESDPAALARDSVDVVVQVNGKLRARLTLPAGADRDAMEAAARADENVRRFIDGQTVRKVIVVGDKLVNIVVQG